MFAAILLSIIPLSPVIDDRVATYEINHFYDDAGQPIFTQRIFWDEDGSVIGWRLVKHEAVVSLANRVTFWDGPTEGVMRRIRFQSRVESWTQFDRELVERERLPAHERKGLSERP